MVGAWSKAPAIPLKEVSFKNFSIQVRLSSQNHPLNSRTPFCMRALIGVSSHLSFLQNVCRSIFDSLVQENRRTASARKYSVFKSFAAFHVQHFGKNPLFVTQVPTGRLDRTCWSTVDCGDRSARLIFDRPLPDAIFGCHSFVAAARARPGSRDRTVYTWHCSSSANAASSSGDREQRPKKRQTKTARVLSWTK